MFAACMHRFFVRSIIPRRPCTDAVTTGAELEARTSMPGSQARAQYGSAIAPP
jgi:hypothetical protein